MNTSSDSRACSRASTRRARRLILSSALLPAALSVPAWSADVLLPPNLEINSDLGAATFAEGLREGSINANNDFTTPNPNNGPSQGASLTLRMGQTTAVAPTAWGDNRTWVYTGEIFTGPNGIISFAANNDDTDWISINGVVVLNNGTWNEANASVTAGLTPNTWVPFEYRVANGTGGAGPSAQNNNGAANWNNTTGIVFSYADELFSLDANAYDLGRPQEVAGGGPTVFRYQNGFGLSDDLVVQDTATLTVNGNNITISEASLRFENPAPATLTINDGTGPHKVLSIAGTTQWATFTSGGSNVTLDGTTDLRPMGAQTDNGVPVIVTRNGAGRLILDTFNAGSNLSSTTFAAGTGFIDVRSASDGTTPVPSATFAITNPAGILEIGSSSANPATFSNPIKVEASGTLRHAVVATDTLSGQITVSANQNLNFDVAVGRVIVSGGLSVNAAGAGLTKSGPGLLRVTVPTSIRNLTVNAGRMEVGTVTLFTNPVVNGGTLAFTGTSNLPPTLQVNGTGIIEGKPASFGTSTLQLSNGGTLHLAVTNGLNGSFYTGDDAGANANFGSFASYSNYFTTRGAPLVSALTSSGGVEALSYNAVSTNSPMFNVYGLTQQDNIVSRMAGKIYIPQDGIYTFGTTSDDGSMLFVDGNVVVNNNFYQGAQRRSGAIGLTAGFHDIDIGFYEGGVDNSLVVDWAGPGINGRQVLPNSILAPSLTPEVIPNAINLTGSANIHLMAGVARMSGAVTMQGGVTLNTTGTHLIIDNLILPNGGATYTFNAQNETTIRQINDSGNPVTIAKTGSGVLVIDYVGGLQNIGSTIAVNQGALGILLEGMTSPTGNAQIQFNGGGVVLSSKGGDQSYNIPAFPGSASLQARKLGSGVAGTPETPVRISLLGNLNITAGNTLTLGTADNYVQQIGGSASGTGTVAISGGRVDSTTPTALQGLQVNFSAGAAVLNLLNNGPVVGNLENKPGSVATTVVGDGVADAAVLVIDGAGSGRYAGALNAATNNTFSVLKNGTGSQYIGGPSQATSYTVNSGVLELSNAALAAPEIPITLAGGVLSFSNPGLLLQIYDSNPDAAINGVPGAYSGILNTLAGVNRRYEAMGVPSITTSSAANNNQFISYNPTGPTDVAPFQIHGQTDHDTIEAIFRGMIDIHTAGNWTFDPRSDDGTTIYIDGNLLVNNNFAQGPGHPSRAQTINLSEGLHSIVITYNEGGGGAGMFVNLTEPNGSTGLLANNILYNSEFTATNPITVSGSGAIRANNGNVVLGNATIASAATLTAEGGGSVSFPQITPASGTAVSLAATANTVLRPGQLLAVDTVNVGPGAGYVVLDFEGPQLNTGTVNANGGIVVAATAPGGTNPLGGATVNLTNGGILGLATKGTGLDTTYTTPVAIGAGGGGIRAGRFNVGPAGTFTMAYGTPITVNNNAPLSFSSENGYTLSLTANVGSNGPVLVTGGNVVNSADLVGNTLAVTGGRLDAQAPLTFPAGVTIGTGATLRLNASTLAAGNINVSGTLEFNGTRNGVAPATFNGGTLRVTSGDVNFEGGAVVGTAPTPTPNAGELRAAAHSFTNPAGGFGSDQAIAFTLGALPAISRTLTNRDLNFGTRFNADPVFNEFFGQPTGDAFTAVFSGKFTAPGAGTAPAPYTFGRSINDDSASIWIDLNQNGVFETLGSAGDERISHQAGCCGPEFADATENSTVNLVPGQKYAMAFIVEDTGGGSSFAAKWDVGAVPSPGGLTKFVNPAADPAVWSNETIAGGAKIEIAAGASLAVGQVTNATDVFLEGENSRLLLNSGSPTSSSISVLRNTAGTSSVDLTSGSTVTVEHLTVASGTTIRKTGEGTLLTTGLSVGNGGVLVVEAGLLNHIGGPGASALGAFAGNVNASGSGVIELAGSLRGAVDLSVGGTLRGSGEILNLTVNPNSILSPGVGAGGVGALSTRDFLLMDGAIMTMHLGTPASSDKVTVVGSVTLALTTGAILNLGTAAGFNPQPNEIFPLIVNDLEDLVAGQFAGLSEGGEVIVGGVPFNITYSANLDAGLVSNDVALIAVPEPGAAVLLLGGLGVLFGAQRRRQGHRA